MEIAFNTMSEDDRLKSKLEYVRDSLVEDFSDVIVIGRNGNETYFATTEDNFITHSMMTIIGKHIQESLIGEKDE